MYIFSGTIFLSGTGQRHEISQYVVHGDYDPDHGWRNDICAIQIRDNFEWSDRVQQVTLPPQDWAVNDGDQTTITGWGYTDPVSLSTGIITTCQRKTAVAPSRCRETTMTYYSFSSDTTNLKKSTNFFFFLKENQQIPDRLQVGYNFIALSNDRCGQETGVDMYDGYVCVHGNHQGQGVCSVSF